MKRNLTCICHGSYSIGWNSTDFLGLRYNVYYAYVTLWLCLIGNKMIWGTKWGKKTPKDQLKWRLGETLSFYELFRCCAHSRILADGKKPYLLFIQTPEETGIWPCSQPCFTICLLWEFGISPMLSTEQCSCVSSPAWASEQGSFR